MKKNPFHPLKDVPEVCDKCGQKIDLNSRASIDHHATARHLPYARKKKQALIAILRPRVSPNPYRAISKPQ